MRRPGGRRAGGDHEQLDKVAREVLERRGATSNFLNYHGFPAVICTSPNDMIVHGIPGSYVLKEGDILSIDCGPSSRATTATLPTPWPSAG